MNYKKIYDDIIERAKSRTLLEETYTETHHIIPRSINGEDTEINKVNLLGREHCLAHLILVKIYPGVKELVFAAWMMYNRYKDKNKHYNCRIYESLRVKFSESLSQLWSNPEYKERLLRKMRGKVRTPEMKLRTSLTAKGRIPWNKGKIGVQKSWNKGKTGIYSEETIMKLIRSHTGHVHSEETKQKISKGGLGLTRSTETRQNISKARKGIIIPNQQRRKISIAMLGRTNSIESKQKNSIASKRMWQDPVWKEKEIERRRQARLFKLI